MGFGFFANFAQTDANTYKKDMEHTFKPFGSLRIFMFMLTVAWLLPIAAQTMPADSLAQQSDTALTALTDSISVADLQAVDDAAGPYQMLKTKFIEGNATFMSLVALALILGLAFCIERIIFLTLSTINTERFMNDLRQHLDNDDKEAALQLCTNTNGPVAAVCRQALAHQADDIRNIESVVTSEGNLQIATLEKGCSWITLCITMAPSLGFLGTVIGMVMAFDQIQQAGDISPTIVAGGMKVALITTIFGIIVALILQLFYNYILSKIDRLTEDMEQAAMTLLDSIKQQQTGKQ